jgi:hypothetical protein
MVIFKSKTPFFPVNAYQKIMASIGAFSSLAWFNVFLQDGGL